MIRESTYLKAVPVSVPTLEMGMRKLSPKLRIVLVSSTMNTTKAAFSKSVSCTCWKEGGGRKGGREGRRKKKGGRKREGRRERGRKKKGGRREGRREGGREKKGGRREGRRRQTQWYALKEIMYIQLMEERKKWLQYMWEREEEELLCPLIQSVSVFASAASKGELYLYHT